MQDNLSFLIKSLLIKNKIFLDFDELEMQIKSHPSFPSLHSITGVLNHFNIENVALQVPINEHVLEQLPHSFIAQIKIGEKEDFVLIIKKNKQYKLIFKGNENKIISSKAFLEQFTGIMVAVEKDETVTSSTRSNTKAFRNTLTLISIVIFITLFFLNKPSLFETVFFILSVVGIATSYLIIQYDLGIDSKIVNTVCSQESKTTNCDTVLKSKGAALFKNIKLSDISFVYFITLTILSVFFSIVNIDFNILFYISLLSIPIIAYSLFYQAFIVKNWCTLCLLIVTVLTFQASLIFFTEFPKLSLNILSTLLIGFIFLTTVNIWLFIASKLKKEQELKTLRIESIKFKRNFELFYTLLEKSETLDTNILNTNEIVLGSKNAPLNIKVITNPFCGHCKEVHELVESLLKNHHNTLNITVRFNINTSNLESNGVLVSSRLLELFHTEGELKCLEAMHEIYNHGDVKSWLTKWGTCNNPNNYIPIIEKEYNWCLDNNINFTPEILINGQSYPKAYDRSDLSFFIEDLHEYYHEKMRVTELQHTI